MVVLQALSITGWGLLSGDSISQPWSLESGLSVSEKTVRWKVHAVGILQQAQVGGCRRAPVKHQQPPPRGANEKTQVPKHGQDLTGKGTLFVTSLTYSKSRALYFK